MHVLLYSTYQPADLDLKFHIADRIVSAIQASELCAGMRMETSGFICLPNPLQLLLHLGSDVSQ